MRLVVATLILLTALRTADADRRDDPFSVRKPTLAPLTVAPKPPDPFSQRTPASRPVPIDEDCDCDVVDRGGPRRRNAVLVAAGGVALWAASGTLSYYTHERYKEAVARGPEGYTEARRWQRTAQIYGTGLFLAGTVAIGASIYLYVTAPAKVVRERTGVTPSITNQGVGLVVSGGF